MCGIFIVQFSSDQPIKYNKVAVIMKLGIAT